jgi:hypothetical protein
MSLPTAQQEIFFDLVINAFSYQIADGDPMKPKIHYLSPVYQGSYADSAAERISIWSVNRTHKTSRFLLRVFADCATGDDNTEDDRRLHVLLALKTVQMKLSRHFCPTAPRRHIGYWKF